MYQQNYKGFEINELYDEQQKPYYNIAKVFDDDPYYEIWGIDYQTIDDAKKAIDNVVLINTSRAYSSAQISIY